MSDSRKYACDISGNLFKTVNKKGVRREKLATELGISVNQLKNYAYDSSKSATLENFLYVLTRYRCADVLNEIASEMGCCVTRLPENGKRIPSADIVSDVMMDTAELIKNLGDKNSSKEQVRQNIQRSIERLVTLSKTI